MSDTTVTTAPPAPQSQPSPASANEAVINPNPVNSQNPVGSQAPEKPTSASDGRREAIQRAFDRANHPQSRPTKPTERTPPKAAEAKSGHNQPPEQTPPEKLDLKKRPQDQPQPRSERGQFAPREQNAKGNANTAFRIPEQTQNAAQPARQAAQLPANAPYREPPSRMADHAKREWGSAPESVRGEIHRMQTEFVKAYHYYKDAHDNFKTVRHYHEMAKSHGTTLDKALNNYVTMEQKLRADPIGGLDVIVNNLNLRDGNGQRLGLRDIAYYVLSQTPDQLRQMQMGNQQTAAGNQIGGLHQEIKGLKNTLKQMQHAQQFTYTRSAVDQFADEHPRFDELGDIIEQELKAGYDLPTAYHRAEMLRPGAHVAQTHAPPAQTRTVDRSISGAPAGPSNGTGRPKISSPTARDAVQKALRSMNGAL